MGEGLLLAEMGIPFASSTARCLNRLLHAVGIYLIVAVCGIPFAFISMAIFYTAVAHPGGERDFVVYWATGKQLVHHANPYDGQALRDLEQAAGYPAHIGALYMRNPPASLLLVYPLGWLGLRAASIVWSAASMFCLVASVYLLWVMHGRPAGYRQLLGYSFAPALVCLLNGQSGLFLLLGLALFLRFQRTRPFLAGVSLWFCAIKPQLFLPFGLVLLFWIFTSSSYRILAGAASALAGSLAVTWIIDPLAWSQYLRMMHVSGVVHEFIPCVSDLMRAWFPPHAIWQEYVLVVVACVWALVYYWRHRSEWDWMRHGSLLILVSVLAAPYSWLSDQVIVIPALLQGAYAMSSRAPVAVLALLSLIVEAFLIANMGNASAFYYWTIWAAPAWLLWYLFATYTASRGRAGKLNVEEV